MSKKWFEMLSVGKGTTEREVKSKYGASIMAKMGFQVGEVLGKKKEIMEGLKKPVQMKRRDVELGLGADNQTVADRFKWNEKTWEDTYNSTINKMGAVKADVASSSDESDESTSEFDGEIVIEKCTHRMLNPRNESNENSDKVDKSEKSKKIKKKEKKDKKDKKSKKDKDKKKKSKK